MRKILNNNRKSMRINGSKKARFGTELPVKDKDGNAIAVGDVVRYGECAGVVLYNVNYNLYGVALSYSMWYGEDKYDIKSYGKFVPVPMDNGARMRLQVIRKAVV